MKTIEELRQDKDLQSQIHWDMKPREKIRRSGTETEEEMKEIEKLLKARVGYYFYIEVRNRQAALYLYENYPDGSGRYIAELTEVPERMIHEAIQEGGGKIETDGQYALNASIKTWLKNQLAE